MSRTATTTPAPDVDTTGAELVTTTPRTAELIALDKNRQQAHDLRARVMRPHWWAAATGTAGTAAWGITEATTALGGSGAIATAVTGALSTLTCSTLLAAHWRNAGKQWRGRLAAGLAASAAYVPLVSATGMGWGTLATLLGTEAVIAARWWRYHRLPTTAVPTADDGLTVLAPDTDPIARLWRKKLSREGGRLSGSELYDATPTEFGTRYTLQLDGARHTFGTVMSSIVLIAAALQVPPYAVIPSQFDDGRVDRVQLQIVTRSPIKDTVPFDGPRWRETTSGSLLINVGPYGDGQGNAEFQAWTSSSVLSGHISGDQGSGKSAALNGIAISLRDTGRAVLLYLDGAPEGGSSPFLSEFADLADYGSQGAVKVLAMVRAIADWRAMENKVLGLEGEFKVSRERPAIFVLIDEAHQVFHIDGMAAAWLEIVRICRKLGIGILTASQGIGVADFGNDRDLRKLLSAWNLLVFRTSSVSEKNFVPGLENVDPAGLPPLPGFGVCAAKTTSARTAPFRAAHPIDGNGQADPAGWRRFMGAPSCPLDEVAMLAADAADDNARHWSRRGEQAEVDLEAAHAAIAALRAGTATTAEAKSAQQIATDATDTACAAALGGSVVFADFKRKLNSLSTPATREETASTSSATLVSLTSAEREVLDVIRAAPAKLGEIWKTIGKSETHVRNQLAALCDRDLIHQPKKFGPYVLGARPEIDTEADVATA